MVHSGIVREISRTAAAAEVIVHFPAQGGNHRQNITPSPKPRTRYGIDPTTVTTNAAMDCNGRSTRWRRRRQRSSQFTCSITKCSRSNRKQLDSNSKGIQTLLNDVLKIYSVDKSYRVAIFINVSKN